MKRRDRFDHILIETTGLADPGPVAQTFFADDEVRGRTRLDGIVTVVDAKHVAQHWDSDEVKEQIAFADVMLLNKTDLVPAEEVDRLEARVRKMNAVAKVYRTTNALIDLDRILNVGGFDLGRALELDPHFLEAGHHHAHHHDEEVTSVGITTPGDLDLEKFNAWMGELLMTQGPDIFRMKGVLSIQGHAERFVFQGVHMQFDGRADRPWGSEPRHNALIFIGRRLDRGALNEGFRSCLA
jgi:G3E family GTPase